MCCVQPEGMPLLPVVQPAADLPVKLPVAATPVTQSVVQSVAEILVASHRMLLSSVQPLNMF